MAHALIVGAGPAGASLAHLLAHRGVDVTLLERQSDFAREFRGEVLVPSGIAALEQLGIEDLFERVPAVTPRRLEFFFDRRRVFGIDFDPALVAGRPPRIFSQPALLELVVSEAERSGRCSFVRGASVKQLLREGGRVVGVRARTQAGEVELRADLVVGADGRASVVRRGLGVASASSAPPMDVVWCKLACPEGFEGARFHVGRAHILIAYRSWDDQLQVAWAILKGGFGELRARGIENWVEEMAEVVADDWSEHLRAHASEIEHPFLLDTVSDRVERWSTPGALVIGDAAHTMSPVGAQGLNIALRDSIAAANHLVPVLQGACSASAVDAACHALESERKREIAVIQRLQALPPRFMLNDSATGRVLRRVAAGLLGSGLAGAIGAAPARLFLFGASKVELRV
jgi:2-polyprenyl-6-methoxyphenol hydroxylase-like FAD-dependent oxidoreductase